MCVLILAAVLSQTPPLASTAVVVPSTHGSGYSQEKALALAGRVSLVLAAEGVPLAMAPDEVGSALAKAGAPAPSSCEGHKDCLAGIGRSLGVGAVIAVEPAQVQTDLAIHVEALGSTSGQKLAKHSFVVAESVTDAQLTSELKAFAGNVKTALAQMSAPVAVATPVPDAPIVDAPHRDLVKTSRLDAVIVEKPQEHGIGTPVYVLGGAAVVVGAAAVVMAGVGLGKANSVSASVSNGQSSLTESEGKSRDNQANTFYTAALISGIVAGALAAGSGYFFTQSPSSGP